MDTMQWYRRAQDTIDGVLADVPADAWERPSACTEWTVRDVAGHTIWGQRQLRAWATGAEYADGSGAPGSPHPAPLTGDDPFGTWRTARAEALETLTPEALDRTTELPGLGEIPVAALLELLGADHLAHAWDIAHGVGIDLRYDEALLPGAFAWARKNVLRRPGFFGPELTPPADADEQTRFLAFLGRAPWRPAAA
jgi:uncharacterized protein (TIGR03086 family)